MGFKFRSIQIKHYFMKTYGGKVRYRSTILLLVGTRCKWAVSFQLRPLTPLLLEAVCTPETLYSLWRRDLIFLRPRIEFRSSSLESNHCNKVILIAGRAEGNYGRNLFNLRSIFGWIHHQSVAVTKTCTMCVGLCIKTLSN